MAVLNDYLLTTDLPQLLAQATQLRDAGHGLRQTYSPKVFIPLTHLCRDTCRYCTFAHAPRENEPAYLSREQVLDIARKGRAAGCTEALFTLGDKPELRYASARTMLAELGHPSTISYLVELCALVLKETGLLPHANPGVMRADEMSALRRVSVSQGMMLESASERLCERGGPHFGSPDKHPAVRLETIRQAGELKIPFTTGILIGIGETRAERLDSLRALHALHQRYGHIQEIIIQNFRAKPDTKMAAAPEPDMSDLLWTIASARLLFGAEMNIQAPPNLSARDYPRLITAGINDWGGISPVTPDHVNPEAPWPHITTLAEETAQMGKVLSPRLSIYPAYLKQPATWLDASLRGPVLALSDAHGLARNDSWAPGKLGVAENETAASGPTLFIAPDPQIKSALARLETGQPQDEASLITLFTAQGADRQRIMDRADALRRHVNGDVVTYVVNRNINYTNICTYGCQFCAFSKGTARDLRGTPYDLDLAEVARRASEAWDRGATEVCMQGGIHPDYTGETYLELCRTVKAVAPDMHIHAFSPLEIAQGAATLNIPVARFLERLRDAGLNTLPGTAAEILDDEVRAILCPDKLNTQEWLTVVETAHQVGFRTTATIMFGHVDGPEHWARHLLHIRNLQNRTGGFTEFVPLPFVHMEAPLYLRGRARKGPTLSESLLLHAVARIALHPAIQNIQASWVKLGPSGICHALKAGVNDLGGTLMNESISKSAGAAFGQELPPPDMEGLIRSMGRIPRQRTTLYGDVASSLHEKAWAAPPLSEIIQTPPRRRKALTPA